MFEIVEHNSLTARIKVIGIGGGGGNAVNTMIGAQAFGRRFHGGEHRRAIAWKRARRRCAFNWAAWSPKDWAREPIRRSAGARRWKTKK